jgi:hypothetical protein
VTETVRDLDSLQQEALAAIGGALVIVQMAEKIIKFCMQYVLQKDGGILTYEKLKSQEAEEAKKTLGFFLSQLRLRAEIDSAFDDQLKEFLKQRNQLAHDLVGVPGLGFDEPEKLKVTVEWAGRLSGLAHHVHNVFMGLARAWQHEIGMRDDFSDNEFFQEIDARFVPLVNRVFTKK